MGVKHKYNQNASKVLWGATGIYVLSFFLPAIAIDTYYGTEGLSFFEILSGTGIIIYIAAVVLVGLGANKTTTGRSVKRYAWGSIIPMVIIVFTSFEMMFEIDDYVGYEVTLPGNGLMLNLLGIVVAFIGGIMSKKEYGQVGFQQNYQQQGPPQQGYQPYGWQQQEYRQQPQRVQTPVSQSQIQQPSGINEFEPEHNYCTSCGQKGDPGALFCNNCGVKY